MKKTKTKRQWLWEFSKRIVVTVTFIFVIVIAYSCVLIWRYPETTAVTDLLSNISDIFKVTVVSYAVKAGFENVVKIRKSYEEREEENDE